MFVVSQETASEVSLRSVSLGILEVHPYASKSLARK